MPSKSEIVEQLEETVEKTQMVMLALQGRQPMQIAKELGVSRKTVTMVLSEALADVSEMMLEQVERLQLINLLRMERLLDAVMPHALGGQPDLSLDPDGTLGILTPPDRAFVGEARQIIKLEQDWLDQLYTMRAKNPSNDPKRLEQTMLAHDELYDLAQENMEQEWMDEYVDMTAQDLLPGGNITDADIDRIQVPKALRKVEKAVDKLLEQAEIEGEEIEYGDESE